MLYVEQYNLVETSLCFIKNKESFIYASIIRGNLWDEVLGTFAGGRKNEVPCIVEKNFGYLGASHDWRFSKFTTISI